MWVEDAPSTQSSAPGMLRIPSSLMAAKRSASAARSARSGSTAASFSTNSSSGVSSGVPVGKAAAPRRLSSARCRSSASRTRSAVPAASRGSKSLKAYSAHCPSRNTRTTLPRSVVRLLFEMLFSRCEKRIRKPGESVDSTLTLS